MTPLPDLIVVQLVAHRSNTPIDGIVVSLLFFVRGAPYYGTLVGMSNARGITATSRASVEADFRRNQALFLMDFRVSLDECDSIVEIVVRGNSEFTEWRRGLEGNVLVDAEVHDAYRTAKNALVRSARVRVDLRTAPRDRVEVTLPVQSA